MKTEAGLSEHDDAQSDQGSRRTGSPGRKPRASHADVSDERFDDERGFGEREMGDRDIDEAERLELFLETQHQTVLPNLPVMDGYHVCWLTTSNPRDSLQWRISVGYELISVSECPGWQGIGSQNGNYAGAVSVNEMVAARISISLYNKLMAAVGHALPMREEEKLRSNARLLRERARAQHVDIEEDEGTAGIVNRAGPMPVFTE